MLQKVGAIWYHIPIQAGKAGTKIIEDTSEALDGHELLGVGSGKGSKPNSLITDVQGRLKQAYTFWRDTLQAPGPVLDLGDVLLKWATPPTSSCCVFS